MSDATLAAMVAGAREAGGHLVLADWLEENLSSGDLAGALRLSRDDPRGEKDAPSTSYTDFRFRLLDPEVMLYMVRYQVHRQVQRGQPPDRPAGFIVGLYTAPSCAVGPRKFTRWLPVQGKPDGTVKAVWDALGPGAPGEAAPPAV